MRNVKVGKFEIGAGQPLALIAGPCVIESEEMVLEVAGYIKKLTSKLSIPFIFKSSYDKANRSSIKSYRGPGLEKGLKILERIKSNLDIPILTDVHQPGEVNAVKEIADILQVPAFLCRQTDMVLAVAKSGKPVNIKKGQFLSPWEIKNVIQKIESQGNNQILITERGTFFGYNDLIVDFRSLSILRELGYPVVFDATHSVQKPGGQGTSTGGDRKFVPELARAASAVGINALFLEVHPAPEKALSDGPNMLKLTDLENCLYPILEIDKIVKKNIKYEDIR